MRIVARSTLIEYYEKHQEVEKALEEWHSKTKKAKWTCFADVKKTFNNVDNIGNQHYVFNIKGNGFRLVVVIKMTIKTIYVRFIGTHSEYDKIDAKNI